MSAASIAHISIPAREPRRVAELLAPILDGTVFPFPVVDGAYVIVARDGSGLAIEVVPETTVHRQGSGEADPATPAEGPWTRPWEAQITTDGPVAGPLPVHAAITTPLSARQVLAIGRQAGWRAVPCVRAGVFGVVELWVEDRFMLELLPSEEAKRYRAFMRPEACGELFGRPLTP